MTESRLYFKVMRTLLCLAAALCSANQVFANTIVTLETNRGSIQIELFDYETPVTVANFLAYVNRGDYNGSFLHRSVPGFIVQGGGFRYNPETGNADAIETDPPIINEFRRSNVRGTVAMAKLSGNPDSATSQWFVNLADNSSNLDNQNGGFTVFGEVIGNGMAVVDDIAGLPINNFGGAFTDVPTINFTGTITSDIFVTIISAVVETDSDGDGILDAEDADDDNDGVPDTDDIFPLDASESEDFDQDGVGDNADLDDDNDGVSDLEDAFPRDAAETADTDSDGLGDVADTDDDNDSIPDSFEIANGLDPFFDDASSDLDGDGISNLLEYTSGTDPDDASDFDNCVNEALTGTLASSSALANEAAITFANPGSNTSQQTLLRLVNPNSSEVAVEVYGIDDTGEPSRLGPVSFNLAANASLQITAQDLEGGNTAKGLTGNLCDGSGKWQLAVRSSDRVEVLNLIRTPDGFLTNLSSDVPTAGTQNLIWFANPASNSNQQTFLRVTNLTGSAGLVTISGVDDSGAASLTDLSFNLDAYASKQLTAQDLENGNAGKDLSGNLSDGTGKWQLTVDSELTLAVASLIRTPDGFLTNLSAAVASSETSENADADQRVQIPFALSAETADKTTFLRIINLSNEAGTASLTGFDEQGNLLPGGEIMMNLTANSAVQVTSADLSQGNDSKNVFGMLGNSGSTWQLELTSELTLRIQNLVRTPDGFLTNLSSSAPAVANVHDVWIFNPASNTNQRSTLRVVNLTDEMGEVTVSGIDDSGNPAPGGEVTFSMPGRAAYDLTAADLESGNADLGLVGELGDGSGKWQLRVTTSVSSSVQSLLDTPSGFLTNLSQPISTTVVGPE